MKVLSALALSLTFATSLATAQQVDVTRLAPITSPIRHAGVYDLGSGKFRAGAAAASGAIPIQTIYNNTCQATQSIRASLECEDVYDEGRLPVTDGSSYYIVGYRVSLWEIAYCTGAQSGNVDFDWEFYDTQSSLGAGGACTFGSAGVPPAFTAGLKGFDSSAVGFPLPGATAVGTQACWIVGFSAGTSSVCVSSGATSADQFVIRFAQNNTPAQLGGQSAGPLIAGNPGLGAPGCGSLNVPPCTDPFSGFSCGNGLDNQDVYWINTDGVAIGGVPPATCAGGGVGPSTTTCTFFGGYPTHPHAGFWFRMEGDDGCSEIGYATTYCTAKVNSLGCTPTVSALGGATFSGCATVPFNLTAQNLVGNKNGLWFYGTNGLQGSAFQGGHLCVKPAIKRLAVQNSGGQGTACNGSMTTNFNARICSGSDAALVPGTLVGAQCWSRDPASPSTTNLTAGLAFVVFP